MWTLKEQDKRINDRIFLLIVLLFLILPIAAVSKNSTQAAEAESSATYVIEPREIEAGEVSRTPGQPTLFSLTMQTSSLAEADLIAPSLYTHFQADAFKQNIVEGGEATIVITPTPITEGNLPELFQTTNALANSVEAIVNDVTNLVSRLTSIAPNILTIQGLEKVEQALDALETDNLEASLTNLATYTNTDRPVIYKNEEGILTAEFGQGFGQYLDKEIYHVVNAHLEDLATALENLDFVLFEDAITDGNVTIIANSLEGFLGSIPFLGSLLDDSFLGNVLGQLSGILDGVLSWLLPTDAVEELIDVLNELIHEISRSVGNLAEDIPIVAETISNEILNFTDSAIALDFINNAELQINKVQVNEEVAGSVNIRALITDEETINPDLFEQTSAATQLDFGTYVPIYSPLLMALIVILILIVGGLILYIVKLRKKEETT